jgi:uncharacterized protein YrzB (UPF0473 family)
MEKENNNRLTFIDENGDEILCEILFTFESEEFKKNYVLFYPVGSDEEKVEVMAASYVNGESGEGELSAVETDEEWDMIEKVLQQFDEEHAHDHCHCEDDDCECEDDDCDCDEECEEDEHGHCCCHGK